MWLQAVARGVVLLAEGLAAVADGASRRPPGPAPSAAPRPSAGAALISPAMAACGRMASRSGPHAQALRLFPSLSRLPARPPDPHRLADASGARAVSLCPSFPRRVSFS